MPDAAPLAAMATAGPRRVVLACNGSAWQAGVRPGQGETAAYALCGELRALARSPLAEAAALEALAAWGQQFTPTVAIDPAPALLLEIGGCLQYFGGLGRLRQRVDEALPPLGYSVVTSVAPTPRGALWLACCGIGQGADDLPTLRKRLSRLPLSLLALSDSQARLAETLGLARLGQAERLPREGFVRRFGTSARQALDHAWGHMADPREAYTLPERFTRRCELAYPVEQAEALVFVGRRLCEELAGFLLARGMGTQRLLWRLEHGAGDASELALGLAAPSRQAAQFLTLWREKLNGHTLAAPVLAVRLDVDALQPLGGQSRDWLLDDGVASVEGLDVLLGRLENRLGEGAVASPQCVAEHRPEQAWRDARPGEVGPESCYPARPAWLLPVPVALPERDQRPWHDEPLQLLGRAERIETGWWDEATALRDYYLAQGASGARYWVYLDLKQKRWFLHGFFA